MSRFTAIAATLLPLLLSQTALAETLLQLSDTEIVTAVPDELNASLRAEASSNDPAEAQQRVNTAMADAVARARKVTDVKISTGSYAVWHVNPVTAPAVEHWQASQSLVLTSHDSTALLILVAALQHNGLAVNALNWQLSRATERAAHDKALHAAIAALRGKAQDAANLLELRFASFKEVRLGTTAPPPLPRFVGAVGVMAASAQPSAVAADVPVSATVEADAILVPK